MLGGFIFNLTGCTIIYSMKRSCNSKINCFIFKCVSIFQMFV